MEKRKRTKKKEGEEEEEEEEEEETIFLGKKNPIRVLSALRAPLRELLKMKKDALVELLSVLKEA
jgi:hypothetical protein